MKKLSVVALTCDGVVQRHLVQRLSSQHDLKGWIVMGQKPPTKFARLKNLVRRYSNPMKLVQHIDARSRIASFLEKANSLGEEFFSSTSPTGLETIPNIHTHDVNSKEVIEFINQYSPQCLVVSGTNLLRQPYFDGSLNSNPSVLNIHTGLSPYSRGGNCNLFCILHQQLQFVGVTVHKIDSGIDSGDIVFTTRPNIEPGDTFHKIEHKVCKLGEDLLFLALKDLANQELSLTKQWTEGRLFLKRTGYVFEPGQIVQANAILNEGGLIDRFLAHREQFAESVRTIEPDSRHDGWRNEKL